jgi:hypothetical protein
MTEDSRILELVARHGAIGAELADADEAAFERLASERLAIEEEVAALTPTTALAAVEQIDLLSQHDAAGLRAIGVLRENAARQPGLAVK